MRLIFLASLIFLSTAKAQLNLNANRITLNPLALPATCNVGDIRYDSVTAKLQTCNALNTWSAVSYLTTPVSIANGGTGNTTQQAALNALAGAVTSGSYLRGNGSNILVGAIQAADVPTLNQNTTGTASNITATSNSSLTTLSSLALPYSQLSGVVPTWNQNTTGTASNVTGTVAIANGGTGTATTLQNYIFAGPASGSGAPSFRPMVAGDVPTLNQNTTGTASNITGTSNSSLTTLPFLSLPGAQVSGNISGSAGNVTGTVAIANGGTNNSSLATNAGGTLYTDGTKIVNVGAGTAGQYLKSNGAAAPTWSAATFTAVAPTIQRFLSGTGTYTTPVSPVPLYIKVTLVGGGGGGAGTTATNTGGAGGAGGATTFGTSLLTANGGGGGAAQNSAGSSTGGTATVSAPALSLVSVQGAGGGAQMLNAAAGVYPAGGAGASTAFGGAGAGGSGGGGAGFAAIANTGSGGGGAGGFNTVSGASGGAAGGYIVAMIATPSATYSYQVGAAGAAGSGTNAGGAGGSGIVIVEEFYQ